MKNLLTAYQNSFTPSSPSSKIVDRSQVLEDRTPSTLIVLHSLVQFYIVTNCLHDLVNKKCLQIYEVQNINSFNDT